MMNMLRTYYIEEVDDHRGQRVVCIIVERLYPGGKPGRDREYKHTGSPFRTSRLNAMAAAVKCGYQLDYYTTDSGYSNYTSSTYGVPKESTDRKREERE